MLPGAFRGRRVLRVLNALALGATLATLTGAGFTAVMSHDAMPLAVVASLSTLLVGALWSVLLHMRKRVTRWRIQLGWIWSAPLAALNAAMACSALMLSIPGNDSAIKRIAIGGLLGATYGAFIWIPALFLTLAMFGLPLARAQKLAERGLAGEEQGERVVGLVCALLAILGTGAFVANGTAGQGTAAALLVAMGALGATLGGLAAWLAHLRAARRRSFVADVEAGRVENYRVDTGADGKVLVRVVSSGEAYRGGERFEAVYELAKDGAATRSLVKEA